MYCRESYAVTEIIALILVMSIVVSSISFIMLWGMPFIDSEKAKALKESALIQFEMINEVIKDDIIRQGFNSSAVLSFKTDSGTISLDSEGERFILYYSLESDFDFNVSDLGDDNEQQFIINIGVAGNLYIYYLNGDDPDTPEPHAISPGFNTITSNEPLIDAIKIDVEDSSGPEIIGRIWLFDTGSITYEIASSSSNYRVITENGGVISSTSSSGFLSNKPNIYDRKGLLGMRIIQLKPGSVTGGSGKGEYQFNIVLNNSFIREDKADIPERFKIRIYGDSDITDAWNLYFKLYHNFSKYLGGNAEGTLYLENNIIFTLTHTICDVTMRATG